MSAKSEYAKASSDGSAGESFHSINKNTMKYVRAFAPATVANVCCGFDILGFAIADIGDEVEVRFSDSPGVKMIEINGDNGKLPMEPAKNTCTVAVQSYLNTLGKKVDIDIILDKKLPLG